MVVCVEENHNREPRHLGNLNQNQGRTKLGQLRHCDKGDTQKVETVKLCVKATISPRDKGIRTLMKEYELYKKVFIPKVQQATRQVIKNETIDVYSQQKWMVDQKLTKYLHNLPLHPMPFHNQSIWIEEQEKGFFIHFKTKQDEDEAICCLRVPAKYQNYISSACGQRNPILGQAELIEDLKYGWVNVHLVLRLPKPESYTPKGWVGVDVGWNNLATSVYVENDEKIGNVTFHGKDYKTRIIQLKHLLKEYQRSGRSWKKWNFRLKETTKYAVGVIAKEVAEKAKELKAGVSMEKLTFQSSTRRWLIPRYKLKVAVKTLCERNGIPFIEVPATRTSITCNRCGYIEGLNRKGQVFRCQNCGYEANADFNAAVNIAKRAVNGIGYMPLLKEARLYAETEGEVATPQGLSMILKKGEDKHSIIEKEMTNKN